MIWVILSASSIIDHIYDMSNKILPRVLFVVGKYVVWENARAYHCILDPPRDDFACYFHQV